MPILKSTRQEITLFFEIHPNSKPFFVGHPVHILHLLKAWKFHVGIFGLCHRTFGNLSCTLEISSPWFGDLDEPRRNRELFGNWRWNSGSGANSAKLSFQHISTIYNARYEKNFGSLRKGFLFASFALLFGQWVTTMQGHVEVNARLL